MSNPLPKNLLTAPTSNQQSNQNLRENGNSLAKDESGLKKSDNTNPSLSELAGEVKNGQKSVLSLEVQLNLYKDSNTKMLEGLGNRLDKLIGENKKTQIRETQILKRKKQKKENDRSRSPRSKNNPLYDDDFAERVDIPLKIVPKTKRRSRSRSKERKPSSY